MSEEQMEVTVERLPEIRSIMIKRVESGWMTGDAQIALGLLDLLAEKDAKYESLRDDALEEITRLTAERDAALAERDAALGDVERLEGALASALAEVMTFHRKVQAVEALIPTDRQLADLHRSSLVSIDDIRAALGTPR